MFERDGDRMREQRERGGEEQWEKGKDSWPREMGLNGKRKEQFQKKKIGERIYRGGNRNFAKSFIVNI